MGTNISLRRTKALEGVATTPGATCCSNRTGGGVVRGSDTAAGASCCSNEINASKNHEESASGTNRGGVRKKKVAAVCLHRHRFPHPPVVGGDGRTVGGAPRTCTNLGARSVGGSLRTRTVVGGVCANRRRRPSDTHNHKCGLTAQTPTPLPTQALMPRSCGMQRQPKPKPCILGGW